MQLHQSRNEVARQTTTPSQRFKQTLNELFSLLTDLIYWIRDAGLTNLSPEAVQIVSLLVSAYGGDAMLESFILHHSHWDHIVHRNTEYIMKDFDEMLRDNGITADTTIIKTPFSVYASLVRNPGSFGENQDRWPISQAELDDIWSYFDAMVGIACNHVHKRLNSREVPSYYSRVDIHRYSRELNFKLGSE